MRTVAGYLSWLALQEILDQVLRVALGLMLVTLGAMIAAWLTIQALNTAPRRLRPRHTHRYARRGISQLERYLTDQAAHRR